MDENLLNEEAIQRYVDGEMPDDERITFEQQLEHNAELKKALEKKQITVQAIKYYGIADQVKMVHQRLTPELINRRETQPSGRVIAFNRKVVRLVITAAACIVVLFAGMGGYYVYQLSPDKVFRESYAPYHLSGSRSVNPAEVDRIEEAYQNNDYNEVVNESRNKSLSAKQQLLVGLAYLQLNNSPLAIRYLNKVLNNPPNNDSTYKQDAEYYLSLAYLKNKQYDKALQLMHKIHNDPNHLYHNQFSNKLMRDVQILKLK